MKRINLSLLIVLTSLILSGCATKAHFNNTPTSDSEFTKSLPTLEQEYSDIKEFDRLFASPEEAPKAQELKDLWGEPKTEKRWGLYSLGLAIGAGIVAMGYWPLAVIAIAFNPTPPEKYAWEKGNYEITATGRNDAWVGYEKRIHSWEWEEAHKDKKISNNSVEPIIIKR